MEKEDALRTVKPNDKVLFIGLKDEGGSAVLVGIVETISEYGSVNLHTVGNGGHYFRTADEYEKLLDEYPNGLENDFLKEKNYAALYFASKCRGWHDYCEKCLEVNKHFTYV